MTLADHDYAIRFREQIKGISTEVVNSLRPPGRFATVVSMDTANFRAEVQFPAEPATTKVIMTGVQPKDVGTTVLVNGVGGNLFISDVMGPILLDGGGGAPPITDHGALTGLGDNDHPQYGLATDLALKLPLAGGVMTGAIEHPRGMSQIDLGTAARNYGLVAGLQAFQPTGALAILFNEQPPTSGMNHRLRVDYDEGGNHVTAWINFNINTTTGAITNARFWQIGGPTTALFASCQIGHVTASPYQPVIVLDVVGRTWLSVPHFTVYAEVGTVFGTDPGPTYMDAVTCAFQTSLAAYTLTATTEVGAAVRAANGSTTAPTYSFTSDTDTGFWWENVSGLFPTIWASVGGVTRWGIAQGLSSFFQGGTEATAADGTGHLQIGGSGSPNLGLDGTEIQARNGAGAAAQLDLNPAGGVVTVAAAATAGTHVPNRDAGDARWLQLSNFVAIPNDNAAPDTPTGLVVIPSFDQVLAKWDQANAVNDPDMVNGYGWYQVQIDTDIAFGSPDQTVMTDGTATMIHGLATGTTYYVRVKAIDAHGQQSGFTSGVSTVTLPIDPSVINIDSLIADGYLRSSDYNGTGFLAADASLGWNIDDDGIEAKALRARGTIEALGPELITNNTFESDITGWGTDLAGKTWQFLSTTESWGGWSTNTTSWVNDAEKVLEEGALQVKAAGTPTSQYCGATSPTDTGLTVGAQFAVTSTVKMTLATTTPWRFRVQVVFMNSGGGTVSTVDSPFQTVQNGTWTEVHSDLLTVPATVDRYRVSILARRADDTTAITTGDTFSIGLCGAQKPSITTATWDNTKSSTGTGGSLKAVPSAAGTPVIHYPAGTDPTVGITVKAGDLLYFKFKYQTQETAWPYDRVLPVFFFYGASGVFVGMQMGEFVQKGNATTWTPGYAVAKVPALAILARVGIGWLSSAASKQVNVDEVSVAIPSQVSGAVLSSGPTGFPRAELRSGGRGTTDSTPRVYLYGSGQEDLYDPAEIMAEVNPLTSTHDMQRPWMQINSPGDITNWPRQAGLQMFPGKIGDNNSPVYAWNALPLSCRSTKNGGASNTATWNNQTNWTQAWTVMPGIFVNATGIFTTPAWATGLWQFHAKIEWAADASGRRGIRFNGSKGAVRVHMGPAGPATDTTEVSVMHFARMAAGDTMYVESIQTTGANLNYGDNIFTAIYWGGYSGSDV